jgi:hypothetical protein
VGLWPIRLATSTTLSPQAIHMLAAECRRSYGLTASPIPAARSAGLNLLPAQALVSGSVQCLPAKFGNTGSPSELCADAKRHCRRSERKPTPATRTRAKATAKS